MNRNAVRQKLERCPTEIGISVRQSPEYAGLLNLPGMSPAADISSNLTGQTPEHCFAESLRVFREMKAEGEQARTLRAWAEYELEEGHSEEGTKMLRRARDIFFRLGTALEVHTTDLLLEKLACE